MTHQPLQVFVESYYGTYDQARSQFQAAAARHAAAGYQPTTQDWVEDGSNRGCVFIALIVILFITIIGILLLPFIFMGRKKGTLTVSYSIGSSNRPAG